VPAPVERLASPIVRNKALWAALRAADVYQAITPGPARPDWLPSLWPTASRSPDAKVMRRSEAARRWSGQATSGSSAGSGPNKQVSTTSVSETCLGRSAPPDETP
jgi:hypothetical protein